MSGADTLSVVWSAKTLERTRVTHRALLFVLGNVTYGVSVDFVRRVIEVPGVVPVPGSSDWLLGLVNCDGKALPLIDIQALLAGELLTRTEAQKRSIIIDSAYGTVLLAVDQITTLSDLSRKEKRKSTGAAAGFLEFSCESNGVTIGVLNMVKVFEAICSTAGDTVAGLAVAEKIMVESFEAHAIV